ncbi:MAG: hypothetical protein K2W94_05590 [Alphaproteobacteria bacterium]|nr:hypothetical protein [Alphaproteobacteria bacterium]
MRIDFKPKNREELRSILFFYWAYWWRSLLISLLVSIPAGILYFSLDAPLLSYSFLFGIFLTLSILFYLFLIVAVVPLYIFEKLVSKEFKTFSVRWNISPPKALLEKEYFKRIVIYEVASVAPFVCSVGFDSFAIILGIFMFYLFAKNEWLPFAIEAKAQAA